MTGHTDDRRHDGGGRSVLCAGYAPLDIVRYGGRMWHAAGGTAGNVAAILGFLGWDSALVADYGDDLAGRRVLSDLRASNVSTRLVRTMGGRSTPRLVHEIDGAGHRYRYSCSECNSRFPSSRPLRLDRAAEVADAEPAPDVYFFDRLNAGTLRLAEHFASKGSFVVFEPSRSARPTWTSRALDVADVVKHASDRTVDVGSDEPRRGQVQIVTGGASGTRFRIGLGKWHHSPAFPYPVVDAGGAGDWTTAGLVHTLPLTGRRTVKEVGEALGWSQALAAISCGSPGARGLARGQSAEMVVRAAQFVRQRGSATLEPVATRTRKASAPRSVCTACLTPMRATEKPGARTATG